MNKRAKVKTQKLKIELRVIPKAKKQKTTIAFSGAQKASPAEEYVTTPYIPNVYAKYLTIKNYRSKLIVNDPQFHLAIYLK